MNAFIEQLDGIQGRQGLIFIGATNDVSRCDPAIVRSGRLNRIIKVQLPEPRDIEKMLRVRLRGEQIKLTESLAAPLIAETQKRFEQQLASKEAGVAKRESALRQTQEHLAKARETIDDEVARRLRSERASIAETEARKARVAVADDLDQRDKQLAELRQNLVANNAKLAEAQQAQADVLRKQRELDDARREVDLSVEKKVQESLSAVREQARIDAEEGLKSRLSEKNSKSRACSARSKTSAGKLNKGRSNCRAMRRKSSWRRSCADVSRRI